MYYQGIFCGIEKCRPLKTCWGLAFPSLDRMVTNCPMKLDVLYTTGEKLSNERCHCLHIFCHCELVGTGVLDGPQFVAIPTDCPEASPYIAHPTYYKKPCGGCRRALVIGSHSCLQAQIQTDLNIVLIPACRMISSADF